MKLIYISPLRYPSTKAGSIFSMRSCESFENEGVEVELWAPRRFNPEKGDPFYFHETKRVFKIKKFFTIDLILFGRVFYILMATTFAVSVFLYALFRKKDGAIYYSHEEFALYLLTLITSRTVYEMHDFVGRGWLYRSFVRRISAVVTTNDWKKDELAKRFDIAPERILVIPNAVDAEVFYSTVSQAEARKSLDLPQGITLVLYTGSLYSWKGVETLFAAAHELSSNTQIYFVGGGEEDVLRYRNLAESDRLANVHFAGNRPRAEVPLWLRSADCLVLPNTAKEDISKFYTSPMKLFEYMASGVPIVASDLPSVRQVVDDSMVWFFAPDDTGSLAGAIRRAVDEKDESAKKVSLARSAVMQYSWERRAKNVLGFLRRVVGA